MANLLSELVSYSLILFLIKKSIIDVKSIIECWKFTSSDE